jgi:hypothetical protein
LPVSRRTHLFFAQRAEINPRQAVEESMTDQEMPRWRCGASAAPRSIQRPVTSPLQRVREPVHVTEHFVQPIPAGSQHDDCRRYFKHALRGVVECVGALGVQDVAQGDDEITVEWLKYCSLGQWHTSMFAFRGMLSVIDARGSFAGHTPPNR